jgi:hypothetical protein
VRRGVGKTNFLNRYWCQIVELSVQGHACTVGRLLRAQQIAANDCQQPLDDNKSHLPVQATLSAEFVRPHYRDDGFLACSEIRVILTLPFWI